MGAYNTHWEAFLHRHNTSSRHNHWNIVYKAINGAYYFILAETSLRSECWKLGVSNIASGTPLLTFDFLQPTHYPLLPIEKSKPWIRYADQPWPRSHFARTSDLFLTLRLGGFLSCVKITPPYFPFLDGLLHCRQWKWMKKILGWDLI